MIRQWVCILFSWLLSLPLPQRTCEDTQAFWLGLTLRYTYHKHGTQTDCLSTPSLWPQYLVQGERVPKWIHQSSLGKSRNRYKKNVGLFPSRILGHVCLELPVTLLALKKAWLRMKTTLWKSGPKNGENSFLLSLVTLLDKAKFHPWKSLGMWADNFPS